MKKRHFLAAAGLGLASARGFAAPANTVQVPAGPTLLTVTGLIGPGNRGPLDPALDQLMKKQGLAFTRAYTFDYAALRALPAMTISPTLEYDGKVHALGGPLLSDVLKAAGATTGRQGKVLLRAIDGYVVAVPIVDMQKYRFIVATMLDGKSMPLGGLGPLWAVYDADRFPDMAARPVTERFTLCPWALYHIEVQS
ncbi:hypothetical protein IMCC9480_2620 [Oxalobacteraceae bacterium IMCC9480]|nr:hypothetical protein IMCC9480_2620 [Oxalobacteraceae bacterium IMCC9480]